MNSKKLMLALAVLATAILALVLFAGCAQDPPRIIPTVIPETTKVLDQAALLDSAAISADKSTIRFPEKTDEVAALKPGDVIVSGVSANLPMGMLRRIVSITESIDGVTILTSEAQLEEAIESCDVQFEAQIDQNDLGKSRQVQPGVRAPGSKAFEIGFPIEYSINEEVGNDTVKATLSGSVSINPVLHVDLVIEWFQVKKLEAYIIIDQTSRLDFTASGEYTANKSKDLKNWKWGPYLLMVGPVPIVVSPEIILKMGIDATLSASFTTGVTQYSDFSLGAICYGNPAVFSNWQNKTGFNGTPKFDFTPPTGSVSVDITPWIGPRFSLKLYEMVSTWFDPQLYFTFKADSTQDPWWTLSGGARGKAGIDFLDNEINSWNIFDSPWPIASAPTASPAPNETAQPPAAPSPCCSTAPCHFITWDYYSLGANMIGVNSPQSANANSGDAIPIYTAPGWNECGNLCNISPYIAFVRWEASGDVTITNPGSNSTTVKINGCGSSSIRAVYQKLGGPTPEPTAVPPCHTITWDYYSLGANMIGANSPQTASARPGDTISIFTAPGWNECGNLCSVSPYYSFIRWEGSGDITIANTSVNSTTVKINSCGSSTIRAIYEKPAATTPEPTAVPTQAPCHTITWDYYSLGANMMGVNSPQTAIAKPGDIISIYTAPGWNECGNLCSVSPYYSFIRWEGSGDITIANTSSNSTTVKINSCGSSTIRAIYEKPPAPTAVPTAPPPCHTVTWDSYSLNVNMIGVNSPQSAARNVNESVNISTVSQWKDGGNYCTGICPYYRFDHWEGSGSISIPNPKANPTSATVTGCGSSTITAVYIKS
jgi:hypothetical protein